MNAVCFVFGHSYGQEPHLPDNAAEIAATQGGRIPSWSVTWTQTPCRRCGHPPDTL